MFFHSNFFPIIKVPDIKYLFIPVCDYHISDFSSAIFNGNIFRTIGFDSEFSREGAKLKIDSRTRWKLERGCFHKRFFERQIEFWLKKPWKIEIIHLIWSKKEVFNSRRIIWGAKRSSFAWKPLANSSFFGQLDEGTFGFDL